MKHLASSIKRKLQLSFLSLIFLSAVTGILSYRTLNTIVTQEKLKSKIDQIVSLFAEARKQEKDFILFSRKEKPFLEEGKSESLQRHAQALIGIYRAVEEIEEIEKNEKAAIRREAASIEAAVKAYSLVFSDLVENYSTRGFKDHGLEGKMREVVHKLQQCHSKDEQWFALMLRRHEKDFFIRLDEKYIRSVKNRAEEFIAFVKASSMPHMSPEYKAKTIASIQDYVQHFDQIAQIEKKIGLNHQKGILGALSAQASQTEPLLASVQQRIYQKTSELADSSIFVTLVSGLLMVLGGVAFSFMLARVISNPIIMLSKIVEKANIGDVTTREALGAMRRSDELGKLIKSFSQMFEEISLRVQEISEKNVGLELATKKEKERLWITEGISLFENIMAKHTSELQGLCDQFLFHLVKYVKASQATLFIWKESGENEEPVMKLQSCYAGNRKRYPKSELMMGEGLIGAAWQEGEAFYMNDIPESYSKIRSGLGESRPTAVFIVPAISEGEVEGIVEIGAFKELSENEKQLIKEACKGFAAALSRVRMQERTQLLLLQSNNLAEELTKREEEMRQNMEELHATQEELERNNHSMQQKMGRLQSSLKILSEMLSSRYKGVLIMDESYKLVYKNGFWNDNQSEVEVEYGEPLDQFLGLQKNNVGSSSYQERELLISKLNRKVAGVGKKEVCTEVKVEESYVEGKRYYSIFSN